MRKLLTALSFILLSLALVLAGCGNNNTSAPANNSGQDGGDNAEQPAGSGEVAYWYPWGGDSETFDLQRVEGFEEKNPQYTIKSTYVPPDGGFSNGKLLTSIAGNTAPDLVISNDYAAAYSLAAQGALEPLDDYFAAIGVSMDDIQPAFQSSLQYNGQTVLMPQVGLPTLLYYDADLFREAGLDPDKPPTTIEELDQYAEQLTKVNGNNIERLGFIPWLDGGEQPWLWGWMFGGTYYDDTDGKLKINEQPFVDVFNWYKKYAEKYDPTKIKAFSSGFGGPFSPDHPFFNGKVAMTTNGSWFTNALSIYAPDKDYRVAAVPAPENGRKGGTLMNMNVFAIPKVAKNKQGAFDLGYFLGSPEQVADDINTWRSMSAYTEQSDAIKWTEEDPIWKTMMDLVRSPNSGFPNLSSVAAELSNELTLLRDAVIFDKRDPKALLDGVQQRLQTELERKLK